MRAVIDRLAVVGIPVSGPSGLGEAERRLLTEATVVAGARRHLGTLAAAGVINPAGPAGVVNPPGPAGVINPQGPAGSPPRSARSHRTIEIGASLDQVCDKIATAREAGERVVVAATGDPGFFGIGRRLAARFGPEALDVRPAASSVAAAFGRLGLPWDDAVVASAHGRPLAEAVEAVRWAAKAAVLASPSHPPEVICAALAAAGGDARGAVVSEIGGPGEDVTEGGLAELAKRSFPPLSVVVVIRGDDIPLEASLGWQAATGPVRRGQAGFGREEEEFHHRDGMITKPEVRAVVLSRLALPVTGVLWDIGAGSGSIGIEAARLAPGLTVYAVERDTEDAERIERNAVRHAVRLNVVTGEAPAALTDLPDPDRVVIGGGGLAVLDAALSRLGDGGRLVATFAALGRAAKGAERLGNLAEIAISRGRRLPDGAFRLVGADPVFVCWGPD